MSNVSAPPLLTAAKEAGSLLATATGLLYACGYLALRGRAHALGTEPGFALLDEAYVFAGFRVVLIALVVLLVVSPVLLALAAAARSLVRRMRSPAAKSWLARLEAGLTVILGLLTISSLQATLCVNGALLPGQVQGCPSLRLRNAVLDRDEVGLFMVVSGLFLAACVVLWLHARRAAAGRGASTSVLAMLAALLLVLVPLQHGIFFADHVARRLEHPPEMVGDAAKGAWLVDRGKEKVVLFARSAAGQHRLVTLPVDALDGIAVTGRVSMRELASIQDSP